jgi:ribosome modulation factor
MRLDGSNAYQEGIQAFLAGKTECPHAPARGASLTRKEWWSGWIQTRTLQRLAAGKNHDKENRRKLPE